MNDWAQTLVAAIVIDKANSDRVCMECSCQRNGGPHESAVLAILYRIGGLAAMDGQFAGFAVWWPRQWFRVVAVCFLPISAARLKWEC